MPVKKAKSGTSAAEKNASGKFFRYVAFLRGINVGGRKIIRMDDLNRIFSSSGYTGVKTLIQSGNVIFTATADDIERLKCDVEAMLNRQLGYHVEVFLLRFEEILEILASDPFRSLQKSSKIKFYISLISGAPRSKLKLPLFSDKKDLELIRIEGNKAYILSHEINGRFGFPNNFLEDLTGLPATTRNWNTIAKIANEHD